MQARSAALRRLAVLLGGLIGTMCAMAGATGDAESPVVAAASDLQFALEEIAAKFKEEGRGEVRLVFGSSGNLCRQIEQGAPFQVFFSADEAFVFRLADAGRTEDRGTVYGIGRIALFTPHGSPLKPDGELGDLVAAVGDGRLKKLAIANPEHAPYGKRAEEALRHAGLWGAVQGRLALGENISQAAHFAASGNAEAGIIAYSLALAPAVAERGRHALIPEAWHAPLRQRMALVRGAGETARDFYRYAQEGEARAIMRRYGFALPGEAETGS
jgi:molybdate transport system substrate-binding protein